MLTHLSPRRRIEMLDRRFTRDKRELADFNQDSLGLGQNIDKSIRQKDRNSRLWIYLPKMM